MTVPSYIFDLAIRSINESIGRVNLLPQSNEKDEALDDLHNALNKIFSIKKSNRNDNNND